jgi:predicted nucleic acid-binding protein
MSAEVFLDAGYAIALSAATDRFHERALDLADRMETAGARLVTTSAVLLEIGNALARQRYRHAAVRLLDALAQDPNVHVVPLSADLYERALSLFRERPDKDWGLTDCVSFVVMRDRDIVAALTPDTHYQQAGFRALLLEEA